MQAKYINMHHNFSFFYRQIARVHGTIYKKAVQQLFNLMSVNAPPKNLALSARFFIESNASIT